MDTQCLFLCVPLGLARDKVIIVWRKPMANQRRSGTLHPVEFRLRDGREDIDRFIVVLKEFREMFCSDENDE